MHANPGGALPDWLVNYTSRELPFRTIVALRAQVKRRQYPGFEDHVRRHFPDSRLLGRAAVAVSE